MDILEHALSLEQRRIYDAYAGAFQVIHAHLGPPALAARLAPLTGPGPWAAPATPRARTGARQVP